jgi:hypothetical protein
MNPPSPPTVAVITPSWLTSHTRRLTIDRLTRADSAYLHFFGGLPAQALIVIPPNSYQLTLRSDVTTRCQLGTWTSTGLVRLKTIKCCEATPTTVTITVKNLMLLTADDCELTLLLRPTTLPASTPAGAPYSTQLESQLKPLLFDAAAPPSLMIRGLKYHTQLNRLVTLSVQVDSHYAYPPFSVRTAPSSRQVRLNYRIRVSPSAGDNAEITVSGIETTSTQGYAILQTTNGTAIANQHRGQRLEGSLLLPAGVLDVGLELFTPYGFSADIGSDPETSLAHFDVFRITYDD